MILLIIIKYLFNKVFKPHNVIRYNPKDKVRPGWGKEFDSGEWERERMVNLSFKIHKSDDFVLNYDQITLDDIDFYINSRVDRPDYLHIMPVLWGIRKRLLAELEWEKHFVTALSGRLKLEIGGLENQDIESLIWQAIKWWKSEIVVWKRAITADDAKALRMITQETKRLIRDTLGYRKLDTEVDNTKKVMKWKDDKGIINLITGVTKKKFMELLWSKYSKGNEYFKKMDFVPKARFNREIAFSNNNEDKILAEASKGRIVTVHAEKEKESITRKNS